MAITAPALAAPNQANANSGRSGSTSKTRSSTSTPSARSALPKRLARAWTSRYVYASSRQ
jgi:hypothetical protein